MDRLLFADWLRVEIERLYPSQAAFAREIGTAPQVVNNWVQSKNRPELENISAIARALGKSAYEVAERAEIELPGQRQEPRSPEDILAELEANQPVAVPVIRDLVAHMGAGGGFIDDYVYLSPSFRRRRKRNIIAVFARGDCMEPQISDGDVVIIDKDAQTKPNDVVAAAVDGHALIRRLTEVGGRPVLRADASGETHALTADDQIVGKVIQIQRSFAPL